MADRSTESPPAPDTGAAHETWPELFAALSAGHDDRGLARAICGQRGNASAGKVREKMRQIADWRAGHALPNRRDLQVLATVLDVGGDDQLAQTWASLYRNDGLRAAAGGGRRQAVPVSDSDAGTLGTQRLISWFWNVAIAGVVVVSLIVVVVVVLQRQ